MRLKDDCLKPMRAQKVIVQQVHAFEEMTNQCECGKWSGNESGESELCSYELSKVI